MGAAFLALRRSEGRRDEPDVVEHLPLADFGIPQEHPSRRMKRSRKRTHGHLSSTLGNGRSKRGERGRVSVLDVLVCVGGSR